MTGILASAACWSTLFSDLLSMAATISALTPCVIRFSICETCWSGSSSPKTSLVLYPLAWRSFSTLAPSVIQRSEDLVGIAMPIVAPLTSPPLSSLPPSPDWPQADRVRAREAAPAMAARAALRLRMVIILDVVCRDRSRGAKGAPGQEAGKTEKEGVSDCACLCRLL